MRKNIGCSRRTVLKSLGTSAVSIAGLAGIPGSTAAAEPVVVHVPRDGNTSYSLQSDVIDAFNDAASSEFSVDVEASYDGIVYVDDVWDVIEEHFEDDDNNDVDDAGPTRGFRQYVHESDTRSWTEGECYMWLTDYSEWPNDTGNTLGSAYADKLFDHDCTSNAPTWAAGSVDSNRNSTNDVIGTFMHEFGHIGMHSDHNHHKIYDYQTNFSGDVVNTSCMTGSSDEDCLYGDDGSYTNTDFGPTMADCVEALVEYQSPAFDHDAGCQVNNWCHPGWDLTLIEDDEEDEELEEMGISNLPVEVDAIVSHFPGEPPAIE